MAARHPPGHGAASLGAASSWISAIESASPGSAKPAAGVWAAGADSIAESSSDSIADALRQRHRDAIAAVHPWFASAMSPSYFHTVDPQVQMRHIESLAYCYSMGLQPELSYHENGELTLIRPGGGDGLSRTWAAGDPSLFAVLSQIPEGQQLQRMRKYTSLDGTVTIINAKFDEAARFTGAAGQEADMQAMLHSFTELVRSGEVDWSPPTCAPSEPEALAEALSAESLDGFLRQCASPYVVRHRNPGRLLEQMMYYRSVAGSDDTEVDVSAWLPESEEDKCAFEGLSERWMVTVASGNSQPQLQMPKLANYLGSQGLSIRRVFLDLMEDERNDHPVMMLRMLVSRSGDDSDPDAPLPCAERLSADVKKLKWIDDRVIKMADQHRCLDFGRAEIIVALANLVHGPLHKRNRHAFTREELFRLLNNCFAPG